MFNNSENIQINGGTFASVSQNVNAEFPAIRDGLDILHRHTAPGATYDSGERLDPPTCDPDTRIAIIEEIMAWILSDARSSSMLWLRGSAGVGKSALAQSIAQRCHKKKRLAASFFFLRTSPKRSDGRLLITTIVFQLVSSFPATRSLVKKYVANNPSIFEKSLETQMQELFINPLNRVARNPFRRFFNRSQPRLIVIDGLDECSDPIVQCELIRVISHAVKSVKFPFRFLIASRPESHIIVTFNSEALRKTKIIRTNLSDDPNAGGDIKLFLRKRFRDIKETHPLSSLIPDDWPTAPMLQTLAQKSSGQFIYASTVIKYVQSRKHRPFGRLDIVLGLSPPPSNDTPFAELDALYTHILSGIEDIKSLLQILAVLIIPRHKDDSFGEYSTPAMLQKLLFLRPGDVELLLGDLLSLLSFTTPNEVIRILHASLADFLLDRTRARVFYIDLRMSHAALARGYIKYVSIEKHAPDAYRNPVIAHLRKAHMTPELRRDLAEFDFTSVFLKYNQATTKKVVYYIPAMDSVIDNTSDDAPTRFPPDSNPEYPWFWTTTFLASLKETGEFSAEDLHKYSILKLDAYFKNILSQYEGHAWAFDFLAILTVYNGLSMTTQSTTTSCCSCLAPYFFESRRRSLWDVDPLHNRNTLQDPGVGDFFPIPRAMKHLALLFDFLLDPRRAGEYVMTSEKYARAAHRCLERLSLPFAQHTSIGIGVASRHSGLTYIEGACLECAAVLLSRAAITEELVSFVTDYKIRPVGGASLKIETLTVEIERYRQRAKNALSAPIYSMDSQ